MNIRIYNYNNYYNRKIKIMTVDSPEYGQYIHTSTANFNPNDGISTEHKFGSSVSSYDGTGDYLICTNEFGEIISRWFIIENIRERGGMWNAILRRDVIADFYNNILDADCFIEKANLESNNPFIFNSENVEVNQIKKNEFLLENNLKTPWIIAYLSRYDGEGNYNVFSGEFKDEKKPISATYELNSLDDYKYSNWVDTSYILTEDIDFQAYYYDEYASTAKYMYMELSYPGSFRGKYAAGSYPLGSNPSNWPKKTTAAYPVCPNPTETYDKLVQAYKTYNYIDSNGIPYNSLTNIGTNEGFLELSNEIGKTIKVGNKYYEITAEIGIKEYDYNNTFNVEPGTELYKSIFSNLIEGSGLVYNVSTILTAKVKLPFVLNKITLKIQELPENSILEYNFTYDKAITTDAVYEIIATPFKDTELIITENGQSIPFVSKGAIGLQWFQDIYNKNNTKVYDVQIVPYISLDSPNIDNYEYITVHTKGSPNEIKSVALKLKESSFNKLLPVPSELTLNPNVKIGTETELWRITSPNGVGNFDFNPYKNKGWDFIEVDCTLIPINPYIKINPLFNPNGLYGKDYNDFRGLICGGDFSVALVSSDWQTYQQQNKNFQNIFDREIESMDYKNKFGLAGDIVKATTGAAGGTAAGALAGSMIVPGIGTAIGAVVGGVASAVGGAADVAHNQLLRTEALDYTNVMFNLNLGNIKARANTLSKTTSFNINNKYFPYIEFYSCTDEEKEAVANKIAWNGMTVMTFGKISDYINNNWEYIKPNGETIKSKNYIKTRLIRMDNFNDDFHVLNEISSELFKGVYL